MMYTINQKNDNWIWLPTHFAWLYHILSYQSKHIAVIEHMDKQMMAWRFVCDGGASSLHLDGLVHEVLQSWLMIS